MAKIIRSTSCASVKVFDENILETTRQQLIIEYVKNRSSVRDYILGYGNTGAAQLFQFYLAGKYDFTDRLPEAIVYSKGSDSNTLKSLIESIERSNIIITETEYRKPDPTVWCMYNLQEHYNYNIENDVLIYNGTSYRYREETLNSTNSYYTVVLESILPEDSEDEPDELKITVPVDYSLSRNYYMVDYIVDDTGRQKYWLYDPITKVYPSITASSQNIPFETLPIVTLRNNFFNVTDYEKNSVWTNGETYWRPNNITKKRSEETEDVLSQMGVDLDEMLKAIGESPDIGYIRDAFFLVAVSPSNKEEAASKSIFLTFDKIYNNNISGSTGIEFYEHPFKCRVGWNQITSETSNKSIGSIGAYINKVVNRTETFTVQETKYEEGYPVGTVNVTYTNYYKDLVLQHQENENTVKTITVYNCMCSLTSYNNNYSFTKSFSPDDENFIIPLSLEVIDSLSYMDRTSLFSESVYLVFFAYDEQKLKWYQTGVFKVLLSVIAVALVILVNVITVGTATGFSTAALSAVFTSLFKGLLIGAALTIAIKLILKNVDSTFLKGLLVALAIVISIAIGGGFNDFGLNTAVQLAQIPTTVAEIYIGDKSTELIKERDAFNNTYETKMAELANLSKELNAGISTEFLVSVTTDIGINKHAGVSYSPSLLRELQLNGDKQYDALYMNKVSTFFDDMYNVGSLSWGI